MNAEAVAGTIPTAFYSGDIQGTGDAVTEDFTMRGGSPLSNTDPLELAAGLMKIVHGHKILHCVTAKDRALYEIQVRPSGRGSLTVGGWFTVTGDRLSSGR